MYECLLLPLHEFLLTFNRLLYVVDRPRLRNHRGIQVIDRFNEGFKLFPYGIWGGLVLSDVQMRRR